MARILLGAAASVAVYKSCDLASKLTQAGHEVRAVLTSNAAKLVSPQLFEAVTGQPAQTTEWGQDRRGAMDHIELARFAELVLIAPCSADLAGRLANGLADDLLTTCVLALSPDVPRLLCPAMNPHMLESAPVQRNLQQLVSDGWRMVDPDSGHMACGEEGSGRLAEPHQIAEVVAEILGGDG